MVIKLYTTKNKSQVAIATKMSFSFRDGCPLHTLKVLHKVLIVGGFI